MSEHLEPPLPDEPRFRQARYFWKGFHPQWVAGDMMNYQLIEIQTALTTVLIEEMRKLRSAYESATPQAKEPQ